MSCSSCIDCTANHKSKFKRVTYTTVSLFSETSVDFLKAPQSASCCSTAFISVACPECQLATLSLCFILSLLRRFPRPSPAPRNPSSSAVSTQGLLGGPNLNSLRQDLKACTGRPRPPGGSVHTCGAPGRPTQRKAVASQPLLGNADVHKGTCWPQTRSRACRTVRAPTCDLRCQTLSQSL